MIDIVDDFTDSLINTESVRKIRICCHTHIHIRVKMKSQMVGEGWINILTLILTGLGCQFLGEKVCYPNLNNHVISIL